MLQSLQYEIYYSRVSDENVLQPRAKCIILKTFLATMRKSIDKPKKPEKVLGSSTAVQPPAYLRKKGGDCVREAFRVERHGRTH